MVSDPMICSNVCQINEKPYFKFSNQSKTGNAKMNADKKNNRGKRSGIERRTFSYDFHLPERREGVDERSGNDRRTSNRYNTLISYNIN